MSVGLIETLVCFCKSVKDDISLDHIYDLPKNLNEDSDTSFASPPLQCVTIENRKSPFYVVNRVTLTRKNYIKYHASPLN